MTENATSKLTRHILLYQDEDGYWIAEVPSLPGCNSQGDTEQEAIENIKEAIELYIESLIAYGEAVPEDHPHIHLVQV